MLLCRNLNKQTKTKSFFMTFVLCHLGNNPFNPALMDEVKDKVMLTMDNCESI